MVQVVVEDANGQLDDRVLQPALAGSPAAGGLRGRRLRAHRDLPGWPPDDQPGRGPRRRPDRAASCPSTPSRARPRSARWRSPPMSPRRSSAPRQLAEVLPAQFLEELGLAGRTEAFRCDPRPRELRGEGPCPAPLGLRRAVEAPAHPRHEETCRRDRRRPGSLISHAACGRRRASSRRSSAACPSS